MTIDAKITTTLLMVRRNISSPEMAILLEVSLFTRVPKLNSLNTVGDEVPVPHAGLALTLKEFHDLAERLKEHGIEFIIEPHLRFEGQPGEQYTMFFKDPSANNLEFKAVTKVDNLFAKYNVVDK
jgi:extradiol dioxygenase family protein